MARPFRAPFYPLFPAIALAGALVCLVTMIYYNPLIFGLFVAFMAAGYVFFLATKGNRQQLAALDAV
jgi:ethanolamine permease